MESMQTERFGRHLLWLPFAIWALLAVIISMISLRWGLGIQWWAILILGTFFLASIAFAVQTAISKESASSRRIFDRKLREALQTIEDLSLNEGDDPGSDLFSNQDGPSVIEQILRGKVHKTMADKLLKNSKFSHLLSCLVDVINRRKVWLRDYPNGLKGLERELVAEQARASSNEASVDPVRLTELETKKKNYVSSLEIREFVSQLQKTGRQIFVIGNTTILWYGWWMITLLAALIVGGTIAAVIHVFFEIKDAQLTLLILCAISLVVWFGTNMAFLFLSAKREVPEREEWVIQWLGEYYVIWEPGLHFFVPFFMSLKGKTYRGTQQFQLCLDDQVREENLSAKVDFTDGSVAVVVEVFYRIFDVYCSQYNIAHLRRAISEKIEAGIRGYYSSMSIDEAIRSRATVDLRTIITQNAVEAEIFTRWGVIIESLAITDIILPQEVLEQRALVLAAEKKKQVAEIEIKTAELAGEAKRVAAAAQVKVAEQEALAAAIRGAAEGKRIEAMAREAGLTPSDMLSLVKAEIYAGAMKGAGTLVVGGEIAGAAQIVADALKQSGN